MRRSNGLDPCRSTLTLLRPYQSVTCHPRNATALFPSPALVTLGKSGPVSKSGPVGKRASR